MNINKKDFQKIVNESVSKSEVCRKLGIPNNGTGLRKVDMLVTQYDVNIDHFSRKAAMQKFNGVYKRVTKTCPVCGDLFETKQGHKREKVTCSHGCSNTFFAQKRNIPERYSRYRTICFKYWEKKCIICGFDKIVEVHHKDFNHKNNKKENLIPICPNHHQMLHTKEYGEDIIRQIDELVKHRGVA